MYVFLDTEFVPADHTGPSVLISIGLCSLDGAEFYEESSASLHLGKRTTSFIQDKVISQLSADPATRLAEAQIAAKLSRWLDASGQATLDVCYDFHVDFDLLERLMLAAYPPARVSLLPTHVGYLNQDGEWDQAADACYGCLEATRGLRRHHALADALALRARFLAAHGA